MDGLLTESGRSFRKWTVRQKVDGPSGIGRSVRKWMVLQKVDGPEVKSTAPENLGSAIRLEGLN